MEPSVDFHFSPQATQIFSGGPRGALKSRSAVMLPSFRLIAATFLCGFVVMFAGLRLAASLNDFHEGLPVMAAQAAPLAVAEAEDQRGGSTLVMYDWRFAVRAASQTPAPINVTALVIDRAAPLDVGSQLSVAPPEAAIKEANTAVTLPADAPDSVAAKETAKETAKPADAVAAISPEPPVPAAASAGSLSTDPTQPQPAVAAVESQAPAAVESTPTAADVPPAKSPESAAADASPVRPADPPQNTPAAVPQAAPSAKSAPRAVVRKKRVRLAQRQAPANAAAGLNNAAVSSFNAAAH
jgi:hypothetical protein